MYIQSGELVIISRDKEMDKRKVQEDAKLSNVLSSGRERRKKRPAFFQSLRFRICIILVIIGIVPSLIVEFGIVGSYRDRAVSLRTVNVMNQCDILCNQMINENYLEDPSSATLNSELELLSNIYSGRVLVVDSDFKIVKDTFNLLVGKTMISEEILVCYKSNSSGVYTSNRYIEMTMPIAMKDGEGTVEGVLMVSISMDEIDASVHVLEQKGMLLVTIIFILVLVFGYLLAGFLVKPFNKISQSIENIADGYMDEDISVTDYAETQLITDAFNSMMARIRTLDESRQEFVSNVSHELKTPLTSMKVLADSLVGQQNVPEELYQDFMQDITEEIDRENKIITDLLSLVKMDKKASNLNIETVNINDMLELILKRLKPIAAKRNIRLLVDSFRPVNAQIDETKLTLAFTNLIENAIKYNIEDGWVRVSLNADHKYFYVSVADSGMGIPEDSIDHIFERFYRVDKSHSREIGGTGLGLAITKSAVMMHHGAVKVYSKEGEGTQFSVRIPLVHVD